jgi:CheY-like chemotaxis protein/DNA-directed RNA polymerase specialized sigma24 family protein
MNLGERLAPHLPFLRRYARALTGSQENGDHYVRAALQAIVDAPEFFPATGDARVGLYAYFHRIWNGLQDNDDNNNELADPADGMAVIAGRRLAAVTPLSRQMLLLSAMEGFCAKEISLITGASGEEVDSHIASALGELDRQTHTQVLIIEDEPIIAMDIEAIVTELGHEVVGIAVTRDEAVAIARQSAPGLVLADIQLADDSSGIDAVGDILQNIDLPVIFITAFPERLLTGDRPEPAFLITKPFQERTLKAAVAQALFFNPITVPA